MKMSQIWIFTRSAFSPGVLSPEGERQDQVQANGTRRLSGEKGGPGGLQLHGSGRLQRTHTGLSDQPGRHAPL